MRRTGGVTAVAVVMIVIASFTVLIGGTMALGAAAAQAVYPAHPSHLMADLFWVGGIVAIGIWGIFIGVGLLQQRRWALWCMFPICALLLAASIDPIRSLIRLIEFTTGIPTVSAHHAITLNYVFTSVQIACLLGLAIWWLTLFAHKGVRAQFTSEAAAEAAAVRAAQKTAFAQQRFAQSRAPGGKGDAPPVTAFGAPPPDMFKRKRPASITVIGILFLLAPAATLPGLFLLPEKAHVTMILGTLLTGRKMIEALAIMDAINLALGIGLLMLKQWARIGTIIWIIVTFVNSLVSLPHMQKLMDAMKEAFGDHTPALPPVFQRITYIGGAVIGIAYSVVVIYFVWTRGAAFQPPSLPPGGTSAAAPPQDFLPPAVPPVS